MRPDISSITIVQEEGATGTVLRAAAAPLLALPGLAMADDIGALTVGTVQSLKDHDTTQLFEGNCTSETLPEDSAATPMKHLPLFARGLLENCEPMRSASASIDALQTARN